MLRSNPLSRHNPRLIANQDKLLYYNPLCIFPTNPPNYYYRRPKRTQKPHPTDNPATPPTLPSLPIQPQDPPNSLLPPSHHTTAMGSSSSKPSKRSIPNPKTHPQAYKTSYGGRGVQIRQPTPKRSEKDKQKQVQLTRTAPSERYETKEMTRRRLDVSLYFFLFFLRLSWLVGRVWMPKDWRRGVVCGVWFEGNLGKIMLTMRSISGMNER